jgi:DNA-binding SARP family transcriptional activator/Tfp pilus assembly protein PilF
VEFAILGPLRVRAGDQELAVGGDKHRRILAMLLLHANREVELSRLIEAAWDDEPPPTAPRLVRNRVAELRAVLTRAGGFIDTHDAGYLVRVGPDELDALVFDRLVEQARDDADPASAVGLLRQALGLWRGPFLAGLGGPVLGKEAERYEERRLAATEQCLELELAAGEHDRLLDEVRGLVAGYPLRERLVGQLMVVLYRHGRAAEALDAYRDLATRLADELGVDPGPEVRAVRDAVSRDDAAALAPRGRPARPAQLPADVATFTGRDEYLRQLDDALTSGEQGPAVVVSAVAGTAGVGKTALVTHWGHLVRDRFPDGQLYVNLHGYASTAPLRPIDALARFLRAFGLAGDQVPTDVDEAVTRYRAMLAGKRVLVVLDNARTADHVRPLLPGSPGCLALVTSRDGLADLTGSEIRRLTLDLLSPDEAEDLLIRILGVDRVLAEAQAAAELARRCAYLPLALRIAAANLVLYPDEAIAGYVARMRDDGLSALAVDGDRQAAVRSAFDLSYARLSPPQQRLFRLLGLVPGPDLTPAAAGALADIETGEAARLLDRLADAHLVDGNGAGRYALHDLLRAYAVERVRDSDGEQPGTAASRRLYDWYLLSADAAAGLLYPEKLRLRAAVPSDRGFADDADAMAWLDAERPNLIAAARHTAEYGPREVSWLLADTMRGYLMVRGHTVDWLNVASVGLGAAQAEGDRSGQAALRLSLAEAYVVLGRYEPSIDNATEGLALARDDGWYEGQAVALNILAYVYWCTGRLPEAASACHDALELDRRTGSLAGQTIRHGNLASIYWDLGRLEQAAEEYRRALGLARQIGSGTGQALHLSNLGETYHALGRLDDAMAALAEAHAFALEAGDHAEEAHADCGIAMVHCTAGRTEQALESARTAMVLIEETGDRQDEADILLILGAINERMGEPGAAVERHEQGLRVAREIGARRTEVVALNALAGSLVSIGRADLASDRAREAYDLSRELGYRAREGTALTMLAAAAMDQGRPDEASVFAHRALLIHQETGHRLGAARTLLILGRAREADGEDPRAAWRTALELFTDIGTPEAAEVRNLLTAAHRS